MGQVFSDDKEDKDSGASGGSCWSRGKPVASTPAPVPLQPKQSTQLLAPPITPVRTNHPNKSAPHTPRLYNNYYLLAPHESQQSNIPESELVQCQRCILQNHSPADISLIPPDVCMCKKCWEGGTEDMRQVIRHRNGKHDQCPTEFPPSELAFLPDVSEDTVNHWRAEWKHSHELHDLCRPHYMFGCTPVETVQAEQVMRHNAGDHSNCPSDFPPYMLKLNNPESQEAEIMDDSTAAVYQALWKHEHGIHNLCREEYNYGCAGNY